MTYTRLRQGHLSVCAGDSPRLSVDIVKNLELHISVRFIITTTSEPATTGPAKGGNLNHITADCCETTGGRGDYHYIRATNGGTSKGRQIFIIIQLAVLSPAGKGETNTTSDPTMVRPA